LDNFKFTKNVSELFLSRIHKIIADYRTAIYPGVFKNSVKNDQQNDSNEGKGRRKWCKAKTISDSSI